PSVHLPNQYFGADNRIGRQPPAPCSDQPDGVPTRQVTRRLQVRRTLRHVEMCVGRVGNLDRFTRLEAPAPQDGPALADPDRRLVTSTRGDRGKSPAIKL